jgi:hypothetical protein
MKSHTLKAVAMQALVAISLSHAVASPAASTPHAVLRAAAAQAYVSPGIAGFITALLSLLR